MYVILARLICGRLTEFDSMLASTCVKDVYPTNFNSNCAHRPRTRTERPYLGSSSSLQGKSLYSILGPFLTIALQFPIMNSTHHLLPSPNGELAPAISAILDVWGTEVHVVVSHNGQEEDPLDRELQSKRLAEIMDFSFPEPTIFLGA